MFKFLHFYFKTVENDNVILNKESEKIERRESR